MQAIFESLAKQQEENTKELKSLNKTVASFYKDFSDAKKKEEKDKKREANDRKRRGADPDSLLNKLQKDSKKKKGGLLESLFGGLGGLFKGLSSLVLLKALGFAAIGAAVTGYIKSPEFRKFVKENILEPIGNMIREFTKTFVDKVEEGADDALDEATKVLPPSLRNRARRKAPSKGQDVTGRDVDRLKILTREIVERGGLKGQEQALSVAASQQSEKLANKIDELYNLTSQRDKWVDLVKTRTDLVKKLEKETPDNFDAINNAKLRKQEAQKKVKAFDAQIKKDEQIAKTLLTIQYKFEGKSFTDTNTLVNLINDDRKFLSETYNRPYEPLKRQQGGPIKDRGKGKGNRRRFKPFKVPGSGYGDRVPMKLPAGSFVMNKKASQYLQSGGMVNTVLEPGEKVLGPDQWGPEHEDLNNKVPRKGNGAPTEGGLDPRVMKLQNGGKVFLHWAGTPHSGSASPKYHATIMKDGTPKQTLDYNDFSSGQHTSGFNSQGVGISLDAMGMFNGRWPDFGNFGPYAVKPAQYEGMAKLTASILKSWGYGKDYVTKSNVMTHAEAANIGDSKGGYGPLSDPSTIPSGDYRWDLWGLYQNDAPGSGGDKIRSMVRQAFDGVIDSVGSSIDAEVVTDYNMDGKIDITDVNHWQKNINKGAPKSGTVVRLGDTGKYKIYEGGGSYGGWTDYTPSTDETGMTIKTNTNSTRSEMLAPPKPGSPTKNNTGLGGLIEAFKEGFAEGMGGPNTVSGFIGGLFGLSKSDSSPSPGDSSSSTSPISGGDSAKSNKPYDIAQSMGFSKEDWDIYRNVVGSIESSNRYDPNNGLGGGSNAHYSGRWQLGEAAKTDAAAYLGEPFPGHGPSGSPERRAFLNDPDMQERFFAAYTAKNYSYLTGHPKFDAMSTKEKFEVLGYAHNQGAGNARTWLDTGVAGRDGFNTLGTKYSDSLRKAYGKMKGGPTSDFAILEPNETVFPEPTPELVAMNQNIPRYQNGGTVGMRGGNPNYGLSAMNDARSSMDMIALQPIIINGGGGGGTPSVDSKASPSVPTLPSSSGHSEAHYLEMILAKNIGG